MSRTVSTLIVPACARGCRATYVCLPLAALHMAWARTARSGDLPLKADTVGLGSSYAQANPCHKAAVPALLAETRSRSHNSRLRVETRPANDLRRARAAAGASSQREARRQPPCHACHRAADEICSSQISPGCGARRAHWQAYPHMHLQRREAGVCVCARTPEHPRTKRLGSRALALAMMNWLSSFSRPSFLLSVPGLHPRSRARSTPVARWMTAPPDRTILDKYPPTSPAK